MVVKKIFTELVTKLQDFTCVTDCLDVYQDEKCDTWKKIGLSLLARIRHLNIWILQGKHHKRVLICILLIF